MRIWLYFYNIKWNLFYLRSRRGQSLLLPTPGYAVKNGRYLIEAGSFSDFNCFKNCQVHFRDVFLAFNNFFSRSIRYFKTLNTIN